MDLPLLLYPLLVSYGPPGKVLILFEYTVVSVRAPKLDNKWRADRQES